MFPLPIRKTQNIAVIHAASGPTTLVYDTFTDADSTALESHTISPTNTPSTAWTTDAFTITGNKAVNESTAVRRTARCNSGKANCTVSAKVAIAGDEGSALTARCSGLIVRYSDADNYWWVCIHNRNNTFYIIERNATTETVQASASVTIADGVEYLISAVLNGTTITATLDGANQISYASAALNSTATVHGLIAYLINNTFDDFKVEA